MIFILIDLKLPYLNLKKLVWIKKLKFKKVNFLILILKYNLLLIHYKWKFYNNQECKFYNNKNWDILNKKKFNFNSIEINN